MIEVKSLDTDRLSTFRTNHQFLHFGRFKTVEEFVEYRRWAVDHGVPLYILGNGSNTLFTRTRVRTLVLHNRLTPWIKVLDEYRVEVASSLSLMRILKHCEKSGLDSFYFLASVPATVGGALAMNAGNRFGTIYDFVESVTFVDGDEIKTLAADQIQRGHRMTMFTGKHERLIVSTVLRFEKRHMAESEIRNRIDWCHEHQDLSAANCGSVFRECYRPMLRWVRWLPPWGVKMPGFRAQYSRKVNNWIICKNRRSWPIVYLIRMVQFLHRMMGKRARTEIIEVD